MPSPFPGMDPYLEGYLWPDVHNALAGKIRQLLAPLLRPRYTARLAIYLVEDTAPEGDIGILYPDVEILLARAAETPPAPLPPAATAAPQGGAGVAAPLTVPLVSPVEVQLVTVEIHDTAQNRLVTSIEILSPVNKREPGLAPYRQKRWRLYQAGVHLIEIDLLRRGARPFAHPRIPAAPYAIALTRAQARTMTVWPAGLRERLPSIPVPLNPPDDDVPLDLAIALSTIYDEAAYDLSINYRQPPPPPPLADSDSQWLRELLGRDEPTSE